MKSLTYVLDDIINEIASVPRVLIVCSRPLFYWALLGRLLQAHNVTFASSHCVYIHGKGKMKISVYVLPITTRDEYWAIHGHAYQQIMFLGMPRQEIFDMVKPVLRSHKGEVPPIYTTPIFSPLEKF
jgi:hypothetical protein